MIELFRSLFNCLHNESINVWSHVVGFILFFYLMVKTLLYDIPLLKTMDYMMFLMFFVTAQICFLCSSTYHLLHSHSFQAEMKVSI